MNWIKKNAVAISILLVFTGGVFSYFSNDYDINAKTVDTVVEGKVESETCYVLTPNKLILDILSTMTMSIGVALFISSFFIRYIEQEERQRFEDRLLDFQKQTSEDAILSVFNRLIEPEFFSIIKKDVLNVKLLRKNVNWQYDIKELENGWLDLTRTLSYDLHNISQDEAVEPIKISMNDTVHSTGRVSNCKVRYQDGREEVIDLVEKEQETGFTTREKDVTIPCRASIEVVNVIEQTFPREYIYETQTTRYPIINLEITVNYPKNFQFELSSNFSTQHRLRVNEAGKKVYVFHGAIYQGQGIEFICAKALSPNKANAADARTSHG